MLKSFTSFLKEEVRKPNIIMPSDLDIPVFLMCPPFSLDASQPNNDLMKELPPKERKVDLQKAMGQFMQIYIFATKIGLIYLLPAKKGLGDIPYVANLGINLPHKNNNTIIISNYKAKNRKGETQVGCDFFENLGYDCVVPPYHFEGEADLKFLNKNNYCGAFGMRTEMKVLDWFSEKYDMNIIPIKMIDGTSYHLDCVLLPMASDLVFAATYNIDRAATKKMEKFVSIVPIEKKYIGLTGLTNCVRIGSYLLNGTNIDSLKKNTEDYEIEKAKNEQLEKLCSLYGYDVVFFDITEFTKSGAALSCMFMHLNYVDLEKEVI